MTRVSDLMSSPVVSCRGEASLGEVAALLAERRIHGILVLDEAGRMAGVVADTDLLAGEWLATDDESLETMRSMTAGELMTVPAVTIDAGAAIADAAARLRDERLSRLIVTQGELPVGVLATSDLVRYLGHGTPRPRRRRRRDVARARRLPGGCHCAPGGPRDDRAPCPAVVVVAANGSPLGVVTGTDLLDLVGEDADA